MYFADRANGAVPNPFAQETRGFGGLIPNRNLRGDAGLAGDFGHAARFINGVGERLLAKNMFAFFHGGDGDCCVQIVGGADDDCVNIFLLLKEFAEIGVRRASFVISRARLRGVQGIHDFLAGLAARYAAGDTQSMGELNRLVRAQPIPAGVHTQQFADGIAELVGIPLRIVCGAFVRIADGHALDVGLL